MKKVVELDQFRRKLAQDQPVEAHAAHPPKRFSASAPDQKPPATSRKENTGPKTPTQKLTKPAQYFRLRFEKALSELKAEALKELDKAKTREDFKLKINVSLVLKRAKSSPLTVYSPLHRDTLLPMVERASQDLDEAFEAKFTTRRRNPDTVTHLKAELKKQKNDFEQQLAKITSQKLTQLIEERDR